MILRIDDIVSGIKKKDKKQQQKGPQEQPQPEQGETVFNL
jgi:hypothetical protein